MSCIIAPDTSAELQRIVQRIRNGLEAIGEAHTDIWAHRFAIGENLNLIHDGLVPKRKWGRFLKEQFGLSRTAAFNYGQLAKHRTEIDPFVQRSEQTGRLFSISAALRLIAPPKAKTPRPKTFAEIADPAALGQYLEANRELLFKALSYAPTLKAEIDQRRERPIATKLARRSGDARAHWADRMDAAASRH